MQPENAEAEVFHPRRYELDRLAVSIGLAANVLLAVAKLGVGLAAGSRALFADGVNSSADVIYYIAVLILLRYSRRGPDPEHPYGHFQLETIGSVVVGAFVLTTAGAIFWSAVQSIILGAAEDVGTIALWVAGATVVIKLFLTGFTKGVARRTRNLSILALARDHQNDVLAAVGVMFAVAGASLGYPLADPIGAMVVALFIFLSGISIIRESSAELMDTLPPEYFGPELERVVSDVPGVRGVGPIKAHRFGPFMVAHAEITVDSSLTVTEGHDVAVSVERCLKERLRYLIDVIVHVNPS